ncbi:MAG: DUF1521 domain-containing protein [Sphingomonadales bacterium]|nr:DUF1521 domain-containing protein [Sphingomonadales bacterium]
MISTSLSLLPAFPAAIDGAAMGGLQPVEKLGLGRNEIGFTQTAPGLLEARLERYYQLTIDQNAASVKVENQKLGKAITIFAMDATIMPESGDMLSFAGKTSLSFGDDSKITLVTNYKSGQLAPASISNIIISSHDKGSVVTGLGNTDTPLIIDSSKSGYRLDEIHKDGLLLVEKNDGDYEHEDGAVLDQLLLNKTLEGGKFGPQTNKQSDQEFMQKMIAVMVRNLSLMSVSMAYSSLTDPIREDIIRDSNRSSDEQKAYERRLRILHEQKDFSAQLD